MCDTIPSSKTSSHDSNHSIILDDESSSSDACMSSLDDEIDRLNRIRQVDDNDFDYKIKWFFDQFEQKSADHEVNDQPPTTNNSFQDTFMGSFAKHD